jgi:hypothetical protein
MGAQSYLSCFGIVMRILFKNITDGFLAFGEKNHTTKKNLKVYILYNVHQLDNHNSTLAIIRHHDATINDRHIMH